MTRVVFPNNVKEVIAKVYVLLINDPIQRKFPLFGDDFSTSFRSFDFRRNTFYVGIESCIFVNVDANVEVKICTNVEC